MRKISENTAVLYCYLNLNNPLVLWETYVGRMASSDYINDPSFSPISLRHYSVLRNYINGYKKVLILELRLENIRKIFYPDKVSRLTGLYFFEDKDVALKAKDEWHLNHFKEESLVDVGFTYTNITRVDAKWIDNNHDNPNDNWMHDYWQGNPSGNDTLWEIIVSGIGIIWENSVRKIAWDKYKSIFPDSLVLLDLSRIAFELNINSVVDCKLGRVLPFVQKIKDNHYRVNHLIDFRDARNEIFIEKLKNYKGPRNAIPDLNSGVFFKTPDLTKSNFDFQLSEGIIYPLITTDFSKYVK
jgi:hypothetical protein